MYFKELILPSTNTRGSLLREQNAHQTMNPLCHSGGVKNASGLSIIRPVVCDSIEDDQTKAFLVAVHNAEPHSRILVGFRTRPGELSLYMKWRQIWRSYHVCVVEVCYTTHHLLYTQKCDTHLVLVSNLSSRISASSACTNDSTSVTCSEFRLSPTSTSHHTTRPTTWHIQHSRTFRPP